MQSRLAWKSLCLSLPNMLGGVPDMYHHAWLNFIFYMGWYIEGMFAICNLICITCYLKKKKTKTQYAR